MKENSNFKAIFFDFDGVLIDTFEISLEICRLIDPEITVKDFKEHHNFTREKASKVDLDPDGDERFLEEKAKRTDKDQLFPVEEALEELHKEHDLFIISNSSEKNIRNILSESDLLRFFDDIIGGERSSTKAERMRKILRENELNPDDCILITDTLGDIKEGKEVGIKTAAVSWGFHDTETLDKGNPDMIVEEIDSLPNYLSK